VALGAQEEQDPERDVEPSGRPEEHPGEPAEPLLKGRVPDDARRHDDREGARRKIGQPSLEGARFVLESTRSHLTMGTTAKAQETLRAGLIEEIKRKMAAKQAAQASAGLTSNPDLSL